ncbi:DUF1800 family protein [Rhodobacter sp. CZR27]|uniref:DUF1800 domain-containing protein n=1 Tax=Rhodobacter sp. CZR27 TaxID=2033869 RepID=UPI001E46FB0B|nr:DUF1800 domain-containing protein [Rhodobacter sp. CZR27]
MTDGPALTAIRFGYGLPLPEGAPTTPEGMLTLLRGPDRAAEDRPLPRLPDLLPAMRTLAESQRLPESDPAKTARLREAREAIRDQARRSAAVSIGRALASPDGFRERLVQFWSGHFAVVARSARDGALPGALVEEAIRPHLAGHFAELLAAVTLHPAMISYLDQDSSVGPGSPAGRKRARGLNENLARELMELHTLGVGAAYSQADVTEMAELLTGLGFSIEKGFTFRRNAAEPGAETVLGTSYEGRGLGPIRRALADLAARPETARHIATKLARHFVADTPDPDLVAAMERAFLDTGGDLPAVYGAMLAHPAARAAPQAKVRQPFDYVVAGLRAFGIRPEEVERLPGKRLDRLILVPMAGMGQPWQRPAGPDGWPEEASAWITPPRLSSRILWALEMPTAFRRELPDPLALVDRALGPFAGAELRQAVSRAESRRDAAGLVLASAEFNRR